MTQQQEQQDEYFGNVRLTKDDVLHDQEEYLISVKNIHKTYLLGVEGVAALRGVSISVKRGEYVCIYGTSGGGKTTLLNLIGTIDKPSKGEIYICDKRIGENSKDRLLSYLRLEKIGFVFQTFNLITSMNAIENVELPMILLGKLSAKERHERALMLLNKVGMGERVKHKPSQMSGGEQQRVTIARALANEPELLLLDEPTGDLDSYNTAMVIKLLLQLHSEGLTLLMVTHDVSLKNLADRVVWMRDGKVGKIENMDPVKRKEALDVIDQKFELKRIVVEKDQTSITEYREPNDYPPVKFQDELNN
ncbi:ABC transporter, putative [Entamoeba invadens IP1]|uniref:ABC transporter, putative n=1 Tax=Entamoeba invadens IP1 TaxID=370355 RepID=UPI0002C3E666|nr:ABC transporter, putative [Entamoeba invadens IP1]ELP90500.1 ABC transporter, putative [Entamoeba invadens IP1]|eukprot:XP_004257271.1 ABC transporter, putative [Entamoeba invadens IP1]